MTKLRIGVIGGGFVTETVHLPALLSHDAVEAVWLCDHDPHRLDTLIRRYGVRGGYTDYKELLREDDLDAVVVATPNDLHYPMVMAALDAGLHVLCEKPLGLNQIQAQAMYQRARQANRVHSTAFTYRFVPAVRRVKELIDEGFIGHPLFVNVQWYEQIYIDPDMPVVWRMLKDRAGSGVLGDLGPHMIDLVRWWVGEFKHVCGMTQTYPPRRLHLEAGDLIDVAVDTSCAFLAELQNGEQVTFHLSQTAACRANYQHIELYGTNGTLVYDLEASRPDWMVGRLSGGQRDDLFGLLRLPDHLTAKLAVELQGVSGDFLATRANVTRAFVDAVLEGREAAPSFFDGLQAQIVVDAVIHSLEQNGWTTVRAGD